MDRFESAAAEVGRGVPGITSIYLFGSFAEGREHSESDVDFGVLLDWSRYPDEKARFECRLRLVGAFTDAMRSDDVDVVILNGAPPLFARKIITKGRRLFCASEADDDRFVRKVIDLADEFEPWMQRMWMIKLEALRRS
jgi:predicted nucleotidyltransferase